MTSTCSQSATVATASASSARRAKSAASRLGAIRTLITAESRQHQARTVAPARYLRSVTTVASDRLLDRVRKLLAKAEGEGVTPEEAQALTAKAAELMAKYGIDRALLAARRPETDHPADRQVDIDNPWARVQAHLLCGLASALRCQCVILPRPGPGSRIHIF